MQGEAVDLEQLPQVLPRIEPLHIGTTGRFAAAGEALGVRVDVTQYRRQRRRRPRLEQHPAPAFEELGERPVGGGHRHGARRHGLHGHQPEGLLPLRGEEHGAGPGQQRSTIGRVEGAHDVHLAATGGPRPHPAGQRAVSGDDEAESP